MTPVNPWFAANHTVTPASYFNVPECPDCLIHQRAISLNIFSRLPKLTLNRHHNTRPR